MNGHAADNATLLVEAAALHRRGRLHEAAAQCGRILERDERCIEALLLCSAVEHERGNDEAALSLAERALAQEPRSPSALLQRAIVLRTIGRPEAALASYDAALAVRPGMADAWYNRGNLLQALGRHEAALTSYDAALEIEPLDCGALNNRAVVLLELGRHAQALASCERALALRPGYADALSNRGTALHRLGRYDEALESYDEALRVEPRHAQALNNRGNTLQVLGDPAAALADYTAALAIRPDHAEAFNNRAVVLLELERAKEALASAERALAIDPGYAQALNNRGAALHRLGRYEEALASHERAFALQPDALKAVSLADALQALERHEQALAWYDRALAINPHCIEALNNRGNTLQVLKRHQDALASYARAIALAPEDGHAHWNEALCRLALGDYARGWEKYEWRLRRKGAVPPPAEITGLPLRGDEDLGGRTVLVYTEQGHGDAIQFIRYAPLLAARGARVLVACHESLRRLFAAVEGVAGVVTAADPPPTVDYHVPLLSLPRLLRTRLESIPACVPYLRASPADVDAWRRSVRECGPGMRVGLAWMGNPAFIAARTKSCGLAAFGPLLDQSGCVFFSLQKGGAASEIARMGWTERIVDETARLADFGDTAALLANLDLVITIDTAVAHLAGALGTPVWVLLHYVPDWRWLLDREDSPWYPSVRLFRQPRPGDWPAVLRAVADAFVAFQGAPCR